MNTSDILNNETNHQSENDDNSYYLNTIIFIICVAILMYVLSRIKKIFSKKQNPTNTIMIIGPTNSGKTVFFYYLLNHSSKETLSSIKINRVENAELPDLKSKRYTILDIPGQGFFKRDIIDNLSNSKVIILLLDSADKKSISDSAEYLYDILNSDKFNDSVPLIVTCNKQDLNFAKAKKIIEADLTNEIENIKKIKQNTTLDDNSQFGLLYTLKIKFNFNMFKNIRFAETSKKDSFEELRKTIVEELDKY